MTRYTWSSIYERELQKLLNQGTSEKEAVAWAREKADEIYYDLVDRGRQEAKDKDNADDPFSRKELPNYD